MTAKPPVIRFRADDQYLLRNIKLIKHPSRPALFRRTVFILIQHGFEAINAQSFSKLEHLRAMGSGIMAVTDEYFCHGL